MLGEAPVREVRDPVRESVLQYVWGHVSQHLVLNHSEGRRYSFDLDKRESIRNAKSGQYSVVPLHLDLKLEYKAEPKKGGLRITGPSFSEALRSAEAKYRAVAESSQSALLPSLYDRLVKVPSVSLTMSPLRTILVQLDEEGSVTPETAFHHRLPSQEKVERYFGLLRDLGYIRKHDSQYVHGKEFESLRRQELHSTAIFQRILGDVISKKSSYLTRVLHWSMMVPYLRWSNAYYFRSLEVGELTPLDRSAFSDSYRGLYQSQAKGNELSQMTHLVDAEVVRKEDRFYMGEPAIFEAFLTQARANDDLLTALPGLN
jgi:hypothetical protein